MRPPQIGALPVRSRPAMMYQKFEIFSPAAPLIGFIPDIPALYGLGRLDKK
jgi:hypothetical protein